MKFVQLTVLILFVGMASANAQSRPESLPFDVKLGGQSPVPAGSVAKLSAPVSNDALLEVKVPATDTLFINFFSSDANGVITTANSSVKEIIMVTGGNKTKINQTMSKNILQPGVYLANIMAQSSGETARIVFTVK